MSTSEFSSASAVSEKASGIGKLVAIWIKSARRGPMQPVDAAILQTSRGLVGNTEQGGRRQVTLIEAEIWQKLMGDLNSNLSPSTRRANLLLQDVRLAETAGKILKIGACRLRINGETKPCGLMDSFLPGLRKALAPGWGGGAYAEVLDDGEISVGDQIVWLDDEQ